MALNRERGGQGGGRPRRPDNTRPRGEKPVGAFRAPFRFARVNRWIYEPGWAPLVSHDAPFADGVCGEAEVEITAKSAILVGGERRQPGENREGEVRPFRLPGGACAIPGSALQGMARAILEVAAFGRLGPWVENRRFGLRDFSGTATSQQHYQDFLKRSKAGWLLKLSKDARAVVPCEFARIRLDDVLALKRNLPGGRHSDEGVLYAKSDARERYKWFLGGLRNGKQALDSTFAIEPAREKAHARCRHSAAGLPGTLVLTGKPQPGEGPRIKSLEFVFHSPHRGASSIGEKKRLEVPQPAWDAFCFLHEMQPGRDENPNWCVWKCEFDKYRPVPVFYWEDEHKPGRVDTLGMAFAFKAAYRKSARDLLEHSCPGHTESIAEMKLDLPHLLFGVAAEHDNGLGLKRRACFGLARADGDPRLQEPAHPSILLGPKPGYVGLYVRQRNDNKPVRKDEPLATYTLLPEKRNDPHLARPELAGVKIWPARGAGALSTPAISDPKIGKTVQTRLVTLPPGTVFRSRLTFHNLRVVELGALLWALSFGDEAAFGAEPDAVAKRHRLGMGKPLGLGEVAIRVAGLTPEPACPDSDRAAEIPRKAVGFVRAFEKHMRGVYGEKWGESKQVKALLKAAAPAENAASSLGYMSLDDYQKHKKRQACLGDYADGDEKPRGAPPPGAGAPPPRPTPPVDLPLVEGARVRGKEKTKYSGQEGIVVKVGRSEYDRCVVKFENARRTESLRPALFDVIGPPDNAGAG